MKGKIKTNQKSKKMTVEGFAEFLYVSIFKNKRVKNLINSIIKLLLPKKIKINNATLFINPNDPVISGALTLGVYEINEINFFLKNFKSYMNFLDVGANVGLYSSLALTTKKFSGSIISLEPHKESLEFLRKNISKNKGAAGKAIALDVAASEEKENLNLYLNPNNKGDNRLYFDKELEKSETIKADTIDNLCKKYKIPFLNFIKIDVQGAEERAIKGAQEIIKKSKNCIILTEFWPSGLEKSGGSSKKYLKLLEQLEFKLFILSKNAKLLPLVKKRDLCNLTGRKYINLVGVKGAPLKTNSRDDCF